MVPLLAIATLVAAPADAHSVKPIGSGPNNNTASNDLYGVSCASANFCVAVGSYDANGERTLIESWNGAAWKIISSPNPGSDYDRLSAVSCISASSCVAAGFYSNGGDTMTLIESWDGTSWKVVRSPNSGTDAALNGVSCTSGPPIHPFTG